MTRKAVVILFALIILTASGCETKTNDIDSATEISELSHSLYEVMSSPDSLSMYMVNTSYDFNGGRVYAPVNQSQKEEILTILSTLDYDTFYDLGVEESYKKISKEEVDSVPKIYGVLNYDGEYLVTGKAFNMTFEKDDILYHIDLVCQEDGSHITWHKWPKVIDPNKMIDAELLKSVYGQALEMEDVIRLSEIHNEVIVDTSDNDVCAEVHVVEDLGTGLPQIDNTYTAMKIKSVEIENILDGTILISEPIEKDDFQFDVEIRIRNKEYHYNSASGEFSKDNGPVYQVEETWKRRINKSLK